MALRNIGNQVLGNSNVLFPPANHKAVCRFQNVSGSDLLVSKFYGDWGSASSTAKIRAVIYSDNGGVPGTLLAVSNERSGPLNRWNALTFATPLLVPNNGYVWFGVISDTSITSSVCSNSGALYYNENTYASGASSSFGAPSIVAFTYRMFLEGEDSTLSFGRRSVDIAGMGPLDGNYQPDREHAEKVFLNSAGPVNVTSISTYIRNTVPTAKSKAAIYSDNAGYPGTKLAQTVEVTGSTANTWLTLPILGGVKLSPGAYWLAFISSENLTTSVIPFSGNLIVDGPMTEASAFPSTYPTGAPVVVIDPVTDGRGIDIYATYESGVMARPQVFVAT